MTNALQGKYIVNTRADHQADTLNTLLQARGAVPLPYPCIEIAPPNSSMPLDQALGDLAAGQFDWLILTSANTVFALARRLHALNLSLAEGGFKTAAIGPQTAKAAEEQLGLTIIGLPEAYMAEVLAAHIPVTDGSRVFFPGSDLARPALAERLSARGAHVRVIDAYQTICGQGGVNLASYLDQEQVDALTFTSSSTVNCFIQRLNQEGGQVEAVLAVAAACIGPKTASTAQAVGFTTVPVAAEHTLEGLLAALDQYFTSSQVIENEP